MLTLARRSLIVAVAVVAGASTVVHGAAPGEYEVKAAYLVTFGRFVDWQARPDRDDSIFHVCVLGADPFGRTLDATTADANVRGRKVAARRISSAAEAGGCHVVFVSASEERRLEAIIAALGSLDVLTVSDIPAFTARGGMVQFVTDANRIRFQINLPPARDAGLTISSELLKVASAVRTAAGSE